MKLRALKIQNFRSLEDVTIDFDDRFTVIVGENDSGKSSLVDCIRVVTQGRSVDRADFTSGTSEMTLIVVIDDLEFEKTYQLTGDEVTESPMKARPSRDYILSLTNWLNDQTTDFSKAENLEYLKSSCSLFNIQVRSNSNPQTLRSNLEAALSDATSPDFAIEGARFPSFNSIQLDGKHFENVSSFFKEVYLKEQQRSLWSASVDESKTILDTVNEAIDSYAQEMNGQIEESGIKDKLRIFLPNLTDIQVKPSFTPQDFNLNANVLFLEPNGEIDLDKKGDGTKRRITMALLELKRDASRVETDESTVYMLDEPDTHLHVRAQVQLLDTLRRFADGGNQVIISTHSPFIMNSVNPSQLRLLTSSQSNRTKVKRLRTDSDSTDFVLRSLGIENVYLFFARTIVLVEGATEDKFLHAYIPRRTNNDPSGSLIRIVDVDGVGNVYGFGRALVEVHSPDRIFVLTDNDVSEDMTALMETLSLPESNRFTIGTNEFEDAFNPSVLFSAWTGHLHDHRKPVPESWTETNVDELHKECLSNPDKKYSSKLKKLNSGSGLRMTKPTLGMVLGSKVPHEAVPDKLALLVDRMQDA